MEKQTKSVKAEVTSAKKIDKTDKLPKWTKKKHKTQMTKIRNESGDVTGNSTEIKRIMRVLRGP